MIVVELTALTLAWIQHRQETTVLRQEFGDMPYSLAGRVVKNSADS
jgi:putative membrane protein